MTTRKPVIIATLNVGTFYGYGEPSQLDACIRHNHVTLTEARSVHTIPGNHNLDYFCTKGPGVLRFPTPAIPFVTLTDIIGVFALTSDAIAAWQSVSNASTLTVSKPTSTSSKAPTEEPPCQSL